MPQSMQRCNDVPMYTYQVRTAAPAEAGKANLRVIEQLAEAFGITPDRIRIVAGASRPLKLIELRGVAAEVDRSDG